MTNHPATPANGQAPAARAKPPPQTDAWYASRRWCGRVVQRRPADLAHVGRRWTDPATDAHRRVYAVVAGGAAPLA